MRDGSIVVAAVIGLLGAIWASLTLAMPFLIGLTPIIGRRAFEFGETVGRWLAGS